jgi:hypothetical protein
MREADYSDVADLFDSDNAGDWYEEHGTDPYDFWEQEEIAAQYEWEQNGYDDYLDELEQNGYDDYLYDYL